MSRDVSYPIRPVLRALGNPLFRDLALRILAWRLLTIPAALLIAVPMALMAVAVAIQYAAEWAQRGILILGNPAISVYGYMKDKMAPYYDEARARRKAQDEIMPKDTA